MITGKTSYRLALGLAVFSALLLAWLSLGVGLIGKDGDRANALYLGVIALGVAGALVARFRALGMARVLVVMAVAQAGIGAFAILTGMGQPWSGPLELLGLNGFFVALFLASAWLFRRTGQG